MKFNEEIDKKALELARSLQGMFSDPEVRLNIARGVFLFAENIKLLNQKDKEPQEEKCCEKCIRLEKNYRQPIRTIICSNSDCPCHKPKHKNGCLLFHGDAECSCKPPHEKEPKPCYCPPDASFFRGNCKPPQEKRPPYSSGEALADLNDLVISYQEKCTPGNHLALVARKDGIPGFICEICSPHTEEDWEKEFSDLYSSTIKEWTDKNGHVNTPSNLWYHGGNILKSFIKSLLLKEKQLWKDGIESKIRKLFAKYAVRPMMGQVMLEVIKLIKGE